MRDTESLCQYRVGIITIDDCWNFGNRLQNLAMQKILKNMEYEVMTFHRKYSGVVDMSIKMKIKILLGKHQKISYFLQDRTLLYQRLYHFYNFNKQYIKWDKHIFEDVPDKYLEKKYDALVVGSDQVWNFQFNFNKKENLLPEISSRVKKISVAASVGNTKLSIEELNLFRKYLNDFDAVSVREKSAIALLQPYYNGKIVQIKDPALLVGREYWEKIVQNSRLHIKKPYVLLFFLGPIRDDVFALCKELENCCQLQIINPNDVKNPYYGIGPIDFLKMIHDAEYVLTDSFHCSVFSILFQKKFSVYNRDTDEMDSSNRTDELLEMFQIKNSKNIFSMEKLVEQTPVNERFIDDILEQERKNAEKFVRECIES